MFTARLRGAVISVLPRPLWQRIEGSPLGYRLARGTFWSALGAASSRCFTLVSSIIVAHILGRETFGQFGVISATVGMFATFSSFGMGMTAAKYVAEFRSSDPERAGRIIGLSAMMAWGTGMLFALVLLVAAPWLATHTLAAPNLAAPLRIGAGMLLLGSVIGAQSGALSGFEAFKEISRVSFLLGAVSLPFSVLGAWKFGLIGAVLAFVLAQAVGVFFYYLALRKKSHESNVPIRLFGALGEARIIWRFSIPSVMSGAMVTPALWACSAIIANSPHGYSEMGLFNAANQWRAAILMFPTLLANVALPMLSSLRAEADVKGYRSVLWTNVKISAGTSAAVAIVVACLSPFIMRTYGASFASGYPVLIILCAVAIIMATLDVVGQSIASDGRMWFGFGLNAIWAMVLVTSTWAFRKNGALGLGMANLIAYAVHTFAVSCYVWWRFSNFDDRQAVSQPLAKAESLL
jgi:O-antigen/teichoic acid export membrane protein